MRLRPSGYEHTLKRVADPAMGLPGRNDLLGKDAMRQMKYSGASNQDIDYPIQAGGGAMGKGLALGLVLPMNERPEDGAKPTWAEISALARRGEELGADTVWLADEILWRVPDWPGARGWWECLTMAGAVAATTSTVRVGTWVMSALEHNPGVVVHAAETLDEISGGRFVLGLGAGHGTGAFKDFGYPADKTVSRYLEALEIIVPLFTRRVGRELRRRVPSRRGRRGTTAWAPTRPSAADDGRAFGAHDDRGGRSRRHLECLCGVE